MEYKTKHGVCVKICKSAFEVCDYIDAETLDVNGEIIGVTYDPLENLYRIFYIRK